MYRGGYMGKVLRVDLSSKTFRDEPLAAEMARDFIGGVGFGRKTLGITATRELPLTPPGIGSRVPSLLLRQSNGASSDTPCFPDCSRCMLGRIPP